MSKYKTVLEENHLLSFFQGDNLLTGKALFNDVNNAPTDKLMDAFDNKDGLKYGIILFKITILIHWFQTLDAKYHWVAD